MMAERAIGVDHSTVHRWVIKLVPLFEKTFRKHKRPVGKSWRMDETVSRTDAAPGGGPPPGTQCFAWSYKVQGGEIVTFSETKAFDGERNEVRRAAALYALSRIEHYFNRLPEQRAKPNGGEH